MKIKKAVFPVAGLGTRFLPATKASPKEMLPIVDKPLIQYVIEEAIEAGIEQIVLITGRGKNTIEDHFDHSVELELILEKKKKEVLKEVKKISELADFYYIRQKEALGLGHAILKAKSIIGNDPFAVLLGDDIIYSKVPVIKQMIDVYEKHQKPVVAIEKVAMDLISSYGVISYDGILEEKTYNISGMVEKPNRENAPSDLAIIGRYILPPDIFQILERTEKDKSGEIQLTDGMKSFLEKNRILGYEFEGKRYDAGSKIGFLKATVEYALRRKDLGDNFRNYLKKLDIDNV